MIARVGLAALAVTAGLVAEPTLESAQATTPSRASAALVRTLESYIDYDVAKLGYTVKVEGPKLNLLGYTDTGAKTITIYKRAGESKQLLVKTLAFEFGHAVDLAYNTRSSRTAYLQARSARRGTTWFAPDLKPEHAYGSGDFSDVFSDWVTGSPAWTSTVAPRPTTRQLAKLTSFFHLGQPLPKS